MEKSSGTKPSKVFWLVGTKWWRNRREGADQSTDPDTMRRGKEGRKSGRKRPTGSKREVTQPYFSAPGPLMVSWQGDGERWRRREQQREGGGTWRCKGASVDKKCTKNHNTNWRLWGQNSQWIWPGIVHSCLVLVRNGGKNRFPRMVVRTPV